MGTWIFYRFFFFKKIARTGVFNNRAAYTFRLWKVSNFINSKTLVDGHFFTFEYTTTVYNF